MHSFCLTACAFWVCSGLKTSQCLVVSVAVQAAGLLTRLGTVLDYPQIFAGSPPGMETVIAEDSDWAVRLWLADLVMGGAFL